MKKILIAYNHLCPTKMNNNQTVLVRRALISDESEVLPDTKKCPLCDEIYVKGNVTVGLSEEKN